MPDQRELLILRVAVLCITIVAVLLAVHRGNIFELVGESYILALVTLLVPMTAAVYLKKRAKPLGAMLAMMLGILTWIVFEYIMSVQFPSLFAGLLASMLGMLCGAIVRKNSPGAVT